MAGVDARWKLCSSITAPSSLVGQPWTTPEIYHQLTTPVYKAIYEFTNSSAKLKIHRK
jgi:hypothetical protein